MMNFGKILLGFLERLKTIGLHKIKKLLIMVVSIISLLLLSIVFLNKQTNKKPSYTKVSLVPKEATPKKELDYEFIKFDTIKMPKFPSAEKSELEKYEEIASLQKAEKLPQTLPETPHYKESTRAKTSPQTSMLPPELITNQPRSVNNNPNMIVTNNLSPGSESSVGAPTAFSGMHSTLIKVVLPNRTPVANGSLVEARVLRDSEWGKIFIPRRAKLIGTASLFNRRVNIDFREIIISNSSHSCSGQAYDLRYLQGLPYSPVNSETKRILLEELRDAVSGVPVVGRVANRATYSTNYNQDVSELDEGLEFYVLINSIY